MRWYILVQLILTGVFVYTLVGRITFRVFRKLFNKYYEDAVIPGAIFWPVGVPVMLAIYLGTKLTEEKK